MPNRKIKGGKASTLRRYVPGADAPANVVPGGMTPQGMPNSITAGIPANFSTYGGGRTRKGGGRKAGRCTTRRGGRRSTRKGGRRTSRKGGGVLATAALPFGLFGLQRLFGKKLTRKLRRML